MWSECVPRERVCLLWYVLTVMWHQTAHKRRQRPETVPPPCEYPAAAEKQSALKSALETTRLQDAPPQYPLICVCVPQVSSVVCLRQYFTMSNVTVMLTHGGSPELHLPHFFHSLSLETKCFLGTSVSQSFWPSLINTTDQCERCDDT